MLRANEHDFTLWLPKTADYRIVVFGAGGIQESATKNEPASNRVVVSSAN